MGSDRSRELLTVVVTTLNEEHNIAATVEDLYSVIPELDLDVDVLLIDDGSRDRTPELMEELCREHERCRCVLLKENVGVGAAMLMSYDMVDEDSWITGIPGDNEFFFSSIKEFLAIRHQYDVVLGYYANAVVRPLARRMASRAFVHATNLLYGFDCRYLNGLKLYKAGTLKGIDVEASGHAYFPELLAKAVIRNPTLRIGEAPFWVRGRKHGRSTAIDPAAVLTAIAETGRGYLSVNRFRAERFGG